MKTDDCIRRNHDACDGTNLDSAMGCSCACHDEPEICHYCNGSGEGRADGSRCTYCRGRGTEQPNREDEE
jgi:hypothetical protein